MRNGLLAQEHLFNPESMAQLERIIKETDAELVLSSSWRSFDEAKSKLQTALTHFGIPSFIASTPVLSGAPRADEILTFIEHQARLGRVIDQWVILDDEDVTGGKPGMMMDLVRSRFVQTDTKVGLTREDADKAIELLLSTDEEE